MKKLIFLLLSFLFFSAIHAQYVHDNVQLVGHWYNPSQVAEPIYGIKYNSVWGWVNPKNNAEYAILGSGSGTCIIDLSEPSNPKQVAFVKGRRDKCIWREYKTYKNYLYAISDDTPPNSFQIIDMSFLPDSVHVVYDGISLFERAHTLFIDGDQLYCASVKQSTGGQAYSMAVYSLSNPEKPLFLRGLNSDAASINTVHDMLVRNDTVYASCGNDGLFIFRFDKIANKFTAINSIESYPDKGYNHSSALTPDGHTLIFCDEIPRDLPLKIADITDIHNITIDTLFRSNNGPTPHNPYMKGKYHVIIAYYQDGLQIFDIRNKKFPVKTGYFDTDTIDGASNNYNPTGTTYHGNWGAYVDLPSGLILASDMQNGLFILNTEMALSMEEYTSTGISNALIYPNPSSKEVSMQFYLSKMATLSMEVLDLTGKILFSKTESKRMGAVTEIIPLDALDTGMYLLRVTGPGLFYSTKFIKN